MKKEYDPDNTAEGWVISNPPVILMDIHLASIEVFRKVGIEKVFNKSKSLTQFLYDGLISINNYSIERVIFLSRLCSAKITFYRILYRLLF